jgi:hypothetical protein
VLLATVPFEGLARQMGRSYGFATTRVVVVAHPLGGISRESVEERASASVEPTIRLLSTGQPGRS